MASILPSQALPLRLVVIGVAVVVGQLQRRRSRFVHQNRGVRVHLKDRCSAYGSYRALDEVTHRLGLLCTRSHQDDVAGIHDRAQALGDHMVRNVVDAVEKAGVILACLLNQGFDTGAGRKG